MNDLAGATSVGDLAPVIRVDRGVSWAPRYGVVVEVSGEHDLATSGGLADSLAPLSCDVLVDLSRCAFIDSTIIGVLLRAARWLEREGHRLDILVPSDPATVVARIVEVTGLRQHVRVFDRLVLDSSEPVL